MQKQEIYSYFQTCDPVLLPFIKDLPEERWPQAHQYSAGELFQRFCEDVIGQQLSGKVARVITARFTALFTSLPVKPQSLLEKDPEELRAVGMSWAKVKTVRDLAEKSVAESIPWGKMPTMSDSDVMTALLPVWGIGEWTVEMFLIFTLGREDVFSPKDLGLKKAMQQLYALPEMPTPQEAALRAEKWQPYRSIASLALWWSLDNPGRRETN